MSDARSFLNDLCFLQQLETLGDFAFLVRQFGAVVRQPWDEMIIRLCSVLVHTFYLPQRSFPSVVTFITYFEAFGDL